MCTSTREPSEFLTAADLRERYHCSRLLIVRHIQHHKFPKPIRFGVGVGVRRRWCCSAIEAWEGGWMTARKGHNTRLAA